MDTDVMVSGFGVLSPFGFGEDALQASTFGGRPAFRPVSRFDVSRFRCRHAATFENDDLAGSQGVLQECADAALAMSCHTNPALIPLIAGVKLASPSTSGPASSPEEPAELVDRVGGKVGLGYPRRAFVSACVASSSAIIHACQMIRSGACEAVMAGGVYLVDQQAFAEFDAVRALAPDGQVRPFDRKRQGLLLGDAAAALVLESARSVRARGAVPIARILGWAITDDAYHLVHPDPSGGGMAAAIAAAVRRAGVKCDQLGYVNAHGTGTRLNDSAEAAALLEALGSHGQKVPVSSTKSTTGHALEACGALEAVIAVLALRDGLLPPTAGLDEPDTSCLLNHIMERTLRVDVKYALSLNSSVGGFNTAILLGTP